MEQNGGNENMPSTLMLCRSGCGFYGSPAFEGMCSKCYKDVLKRRQQNSSPNGLISPSALSTTVSENTTNMKAINISQPSKEETYTTPSVETASTTIPSTSSSTSQDKEETGDTKESPQEASASAKSPTETDEASPTVDSKKPKKNRCHTCKKKLGLTGFQCRCNGLYCSLHRYSDKHDCQFDYKELAQTEIRKQNPVVVGQKVQKI